MRSARAQSPPVRGLCISGGAESLFASHIMAHVAAAGVCIFVCQSDCRACRVHVLKKLFGN